MPTVSTQTNITCITEEGRKEFIQKFMDTVDDMKTFQNPKNYYKKHLFNLLKSS